MAKKPFKGVIKLDVRDSTPDWEPYTLAKAPEDAPNILIVLYDDTGLAAWSPFGGEDWSFTLALREDWAKPDGMAHGRYAATAELCGDIRPKAIGRNNLVEGRRRRCHSRCQFPPATGNESKRDKP